EARKVYSDSDEVCFLLAQAQRRDGDLTEARRTLNEAKRLGWVKGAIDLEVYLLQAQEAMLARPAPRWDEVRGLEEELRNGHRKKHPESANICEVLVPGAVARFDGGKAEYLLATWQKAQPESGRAFEWKGRLAELLREKQNAIDAYRAALKHVPGLKH